MKWIMGKIKKRLRKQSQFRRSQYRWRRLQRRIRKPAHRRRAAGGKASRQSRRRQKQSRPQQNQRRRNRRRQNRLPSRRRSRPPHCLKPGLMMTMVRRTMKIPTMARRITATGMTVRPIMGTMMMTTMGMMIKKFFSHPVFPDTLPYSFNVKQIRGPLSPKKFLM